MIEIANENKWITKLKINEKDCLRFVFKGILNEKQALEACEEWRDVFNANTNKEYTIIFNSMELENYEPIARRIFQKTIKELKGQIVKLWVVTDSKLISGGATIMGMFTSFVIKSVTTEEQITT